MRVWLYCLYVPWLWDLFRFFRRRWFLWLYIWNTSQFSVFVDWFADPINSWVISDGIVEGIDTDDFKIFVCSILGDPIWVQNSQSSDLASDSLFSYGPEISGGFQLGNSLTGRLSLNHTLSDQLLSASSSYSNSINDVA